MADFVALTCPSCGGKLQITSDIDLFACAYCGSELKVKRGGGIVSLAPVVQGLERVQAGVDRTASELAIVRLRSEIAGLEAEIKEVVDWFKRIDPDNRYLKRKMNIEVFLRLMEDDLQNQRRALSKRRLGSQLFPRQKAKATKRLGILEDELEKLTALVARLREKQAQLARHQQIADQ